MKLSVSLGFLVSYLMLVQSHLIDGINAKKRYPREGLTTFNATSSNTNNKNPKNNTQTRQFLTVDNKALQPAPIIKAPRDRKKIIEELIKNQDPMRQDELLAELEIHKHRRV